MNYKPRAYDAYMHHQGGRVDAIFCKILEWWIYAPQTKILERQKKVGKTFCKNFSYSQLLYLG